MVGEFLFWKNILDHIGIYFVTIVVWLKECSIGGNALFHSIDRFSVLILIVGLFDDIDSQIINIRKEIDSIDKYDPIDDVVFQNENASG